MLKGREMKTAINKTYLTPIESCFVLQTSVFHDHRGDLFKVFHLPSWKKHQLPDLTLGEAFFSHSAKNVLRGLHFQKGEFSQSKLISCLSGSSLNLILDLRPQSPSFQQVFAQELSRDSGKSLFIPEGCAHGFLSLSEETLLSYLANKPHSPENDCGILWNSASFRWPVENPILSERDQSWPTLTEVLGHPILR